MRKFEHDRNGIISFFLIAEVDFKVGKRSFCCPGIWQNAVIFINQPFVVQFLKIMDNTFHKWQVHRFVIVAEINPAPDALKHVNPDVGIF